MKMISKILAILIIAVLGFSGCDGQSDESSIISDVSVTVGDTSQKEVPEIEKISRTEKSNTESSKQNTLESSEQISNEKSQAEISEKSSEVTETESSYDESSEISVESSEEVSEEIQSEPEKDIDESVVYGFNEKYFVKKLDANMLKAFLKIYDAVQHFEMTAKFTAIPSDDLDMLMFLLNYDCPELIQLNGDYSPIYTDESEKYTSGVYFTYNMSETEYKNNIDELHEFFEKLKTDVVDMSELEKEKYVYDMILDKCVYDDTNAYSGTVWGTLINRVGRCEGICKSFMWCMRELGIECMCVSGVPKWDNDSVYAGHSWDIVNINGQYYQLDLTIDDMKEYLSDEPHANYGFFNVNDEFNDKTHEMYDFYKILGVPECTSEDVNYHKMNDLFVYADGDIEQQVKKILENNFSEGIIDHVSVKFEDIAALNNAYAHIDEWIKEFFEEKGMSICESDSQSDKVCQTITVYAEGSEECTAE